MDGVLENNPIMGLYGLFDRVDGEFNNGFELLESDEKAAISLAKTFALGNINRDEFELHHVANINCKTGEVFPVPTYIVECNEEVYSRAVALLGKNKEVEKKKEVDYESA